MLQEIPPHISNVTSWATRGPLVVIRKLANVHRRTSTDGCGRLCRARRRLHVVATLVAMFALFTSGCVQRRMTIRTNPPGALVYIDDYYIGTTPVATDFTYYGKRKIRLVKDGYEILTVPKYDISPPWYEVFPLEFVAENIVPWEIRDERLLDFQLVPQVIVPQDQLLARADQLRSQTQLNTQAIVAPGSVIVPGTMPGVPTYIPPGPTVPQPLPPPLYPVQPPPTQPLLSPPPGTYPFTPPPALPLPGRY